MLKNTLLLTRRGLLGLLATAALAAVGTVGLYAVATDSEAGQLLASELPAGTSLSTASNEQVVVATRKAVRKAPRLAVSVVRVAILSKTPPRSRRPLESSAGSSGRFKDVIDRSKEDPCPPCDFVVGVARSAILEASSETSQIIEEASALCPSCAGDLQNLANDPGLGIGIGGSNAFYDAAGPFGFGAGLGPGFPGSPGFVGSAPGGVLSLPPTGPAVTAVLNQ